MSIVPHAPPTPYEETLAADVEAWRVAHGACVSHLRRCLECGIELCPDGQQLWDAADQAERVLPWRIAS